MVSSGRRPNRSALIASGPLHRVKEACRIDEVFIFAAYRVRDFDEAVHGSEDIKVYFAAEAGTAAFTAGAMLCLETWSGHRLHLVAVARRFRFRHSPSDSRDRTTVPYI